MSTKIKYSRFLPFVVFLSISLAVFNTIFISCKKSGTTVYKLVDSGAGNRLYDAISVNSNYFPFLNALNVSGLNVLLSKSGAYTLFLSNSYSLGQYRYPEDFNAAYAYCSNSIVNERIALKSLPIGPEFPIKTLSGNFIYIKKYLLDQDTLISVNGSILGTVDFPFTNGNLNSYFVDVRGNLNSIVFSSNFSLFPNLRALISNSINLTYFSAALKVSHLDTSLSNPNALLTVFAPTDAAFKLAGFPNLDSVLHTNPDTLRKIISYHILPGKLYYLDLYFLFKGSTSALLNTINGEPFIISGTPDLTSKYHNVFSDISHVDSKGNKVLVFKNFGFVNAPSGNGILHLVDNILKP